MLPSDAYKVEFYRTRGTDINLLRAVEVMTEQLTSVLEENTGLYCSL